MGCGGSKNTKTSNPSKAVTLASPGNFGGFTTANRFVMASMQRGRCAP